MAPSAGLFRLVYEAGHHVCHQQHHGLSRGVRAAFGLFAQQQGNGSFAENGKGCRSAKRHLDELEQKGYLDSYEYEASQKMIAERDKMNIMLPVMENETILDIFKKDSDSYLYDKMELTNGFCLVARSKGGE